MARVLRAETDYRLQNPLIWRETALALLVEVPVERTAYSGRRLVENIKLWLPKKEALYDTARGLIELPGWLILRKESEIAHQTRCRKASICLDFKRVLPRQAPRASAR